VDNGKKKAESERSDVARMDPSDKRVIGQQVVTRILELIRTGTLRAGDRLPPKRELVEIFGISRASLSEALQALSMLGVINSPSRRRRLCQRS
jgi:GntR family transcriptional repressor for pyruvate dehydrogenase complex